MVCVTNNEIRWQADISGTILIYKLPLQPVTLGFGLGLSLGLKAKIFGIGLAVPSLALALALSLVIFLTSLVPGSQHWTRISRDFWTSIDVISFVGYIDTLHVLRVVNMFTFFVGWQDIIDQQKQLIAKLRSAASKSLPNLTYSQPKHRSSRLPDTGNVLYAIGYYYRAFADKAVITIAIPLRYDYDTTIPRRIRLRRKWSKLRFDCDTTTIRLRRIARACFHSTRFDASKNEHASFSS